MDTINKKDNDEKSDVGHEDVGEEHTRDWTVIMLDSRDRKDRTGWKGLGKVGQTAGRKRPREDDNPQQRDREG